MKSFDLIVIGGGPGGYAAAIRASQLGLSVVLVEKGGKLGGACLHRGCIPSKAYLAAASMIHSSRRAARIGIDFPPPRIDFEKLVSSKDGKVDRLSRGIKDLVAARKVTVLSDPGGAVLEGVGKVRVGADILEGRFVLLATGSEPVRPALFPFDGKTVLTTDELFSLTELPQRLLVVGGGVIGCEIACAFNLLGSEVTIVEMMPTLLPEEERSAVRSLQSIFDKRGIVVKTGVRVEKVEKGKDLRIELTDKSSTLATTLLVAVGRRLGDDHLGLARQGIVLENGFVKVNERMETSVAGIYAVGDLIGTTMLAHGAMEEGICAVENIAGESRTIDYEAIPRVVYTIPEIASIGRTETQLKEKGVAYRAGRFAYLANGMALCHEEEEGFAQILVGTEGDRILGATIFGAHASDLIHEAALVMAGNRPVQELIRTVHAHPSLGEIVHEAAEDAFGMAIHKVGRPK